MSRDARTSPRPLGRVTLVGAGLGDPDLLTMRAVDRLAAADIILYDALSAGHPGLRALAPEARWFYVGKRAGRESIAQETINRLMIREAERGLHVVRLKAGDPFVLGRGGEEALALAAAGVPCEVVPGVSSAFAGPALAGIPVTHRGLAAAVTVVSGHSEEAWGPAVQSLPERGVTLVVLMGLGARAALTQRLLTRGFSPQTPAALVLGASWADQWRWLGTLAELPSVSLPRAPVPPGHGTKDTAPGVIVIGDVVSLAATVVPDATAAPTPSSHAQGVGS